MLNKLTYSSCFVKICFAITILQFIMYFQHFPIYTEKQRLYKQVSLSNEYISQLFIKILQVLYILNKFLSRNTEIYFLVNATPIILVLLN